MSIQKCQCSCCKKTEDGTFQNEKCINCGKDILTYRRGSCDWEPKKCNECFFKEQQIEKKN